MSRHQRDRVEGSLPHVVEGVVGFKDVIELPCVNDVSLVYEVKSFI